MYMERLRRSQNVFVGLFQTGVKMLGLAEGQKQRQRSGVSKIFLSGFGYREGDGSTRNFYDKVTL